MRIAVCDDDIIMLDMLADIIGSGFSKNDCQYEIGKFHSGNDLLKSHYDKQFDVIFLDIHMPDIDGFGVAKEVRNISDKTFIIFVTTQEELIYDSFDFQPFNFVKKEAGVLTERRIFGIIKKLLRHYKQCDSLMLESAASEKRLVFIKDIIYLTSDKNYVEYILTDDSRHKIRGTLSEAEKKFEKYDFLKIHKSFIVNMKHILKISFADCEVKLTNGYSAYIGKSYKKVIDEKYILYQRSLR